MTVVARAAPPRGATPSGVQELRAAASDCAAQPEGVAERLNTLAADGLVYNGTDPPTG